MGAGGSTCSNAMGSTEEVISIRPWGGQGGDSGVGGKTLLSYDTQCHALTEHDFEFTIEYCAKTPDPSFSMDTLGIMEGKDADVSSKCYLDIVCALCNGRYLEEVLDSVNYLEENKKMSFKVPIYRT